MNLPRKMMGILPKVGFCLGMAFFAGTATADTVNTFSAYSCLYAVNTGNQGGPTEGAAFFSGNQSSSITFCPLDRINSPSTTAISSIAVRVQDNTANDQVSCQAISCDGLGLVCSASAFGKSGDSFVGDKSLSLGSVTAYNEGYAYIWCDFTPGTAKIYSYRATD